MRKGVPLTNSLTNLSYCHKVLNNIAWALQMTISQSSWLSLSTRRPFARNVSQRKEWSGDLLSWQRNHVDCLWMQSPHIASLEQCFLVSKLARDVIPVCKSGCTFRFSCVFSWLSWDVARVMFLCSEMQMPSECCGWCSWGHAVADASSLATPACFWHNIASSLRCWLWPQRISVGWN